MKSTSRSTIATIPSLDHLEVLQAKLKGRQFPLHFHDTFVIQRIVSGTDFCRGTGIAAGPSQVFIHTPYASHAGGPKQDGLLEYRAIYPSVKLVEELIGSRLPQIPEVSLVSESASLRRAIDAFFSMGAGSNRNGLLVEIAKRVVDEVVDFEKGSRVRDGQRPCGDLSVARDYLIQNCHREVSTSELSDACYLSRFHLIRKFKNHFGITPHQFLISQRVVSAKKFIAQGVPIPIAAIKSGFTDQSHLTRCFKRISGFNPGQYAQG